MRERYFIFVRERVAIRQQGKRDEIKKEREKERKKRTKGEDATKRDIVPLLSKSAECRPNFSAALPIYILYIKIGGFTLLDMRVFRIYVYTYTYTYTYIYILAARMYPSSNVSLARPEERGKTVARIFRLSVFHQSHPLLFFPVSPFFLPPPFSPPSVSPRFLPLVDGKGENLAGE